MAPTDPVAMQGKLTFENRCLACHSIGGGDKLGPDLFDVSKRRSDAWLTRWLKNPDEMLKSDQVAKAMLDKYKVPMPDQHLSDPEIREYIAYFKWADEHLQVQGQQQPQQSAPGTSLQPNQTLSGQPSAVNVPPSQNSPTGVVTIPADAKAKGK